ncbi:hypothetical protein MHYP_G00156910 [Metynnis hypsauchen]
MCPAGCSHVNGFKVDNWKQNLRVIYQCFVWSGTAETRRRKVSGGETKRRLARLGPARPGPANPAGLRWDRVMLTEHNLNCAAGLRPATPRTRLEAHQPHKPGYVQSTVSCRAVELQSCRTVEL